MSSRTSITRTWTVAAWAMAAGPWLGATVQAHGLSTTLANGQRLSVVEVSTADRSGLSFERRYPDGARDRQFGPGGRVFFDVGGSGITPTAVHADALGNILLAGSAPFGDRPHGAMVVRFLATGQLDSRWADQGTARLPVARGDSQATDLLAGSDGGLYVVGRVEDKGRQQASIWHLNAAGQADLRFGQQGAMLGAARPLSQVLSIQRDADGAIVLAVQSSEDGKTWIEMHRWRPGDAHPLRVARQALPEQWVGPASLWRRDAQWYWFDPPQPDALVPVERLNAPDSPWAPSAPPPIVAVKPADPAGPPAEEPPTAFESSLSAEPAEPAPSRIGFVVFAVAVLLGGVVAWRALRR